MNSESPRTKRSFTLDNRFLPKRPLSAILVSKKYDIEKSSEKVDGEEDEIQNPWLKGEKYNGFDVLQQNFKLGLNASKEFAEFLKERSSIEETYSKSLLKLATKCSAANSSVGTFEPCWKFLQGSTEKLANVHNQVIQHLNEVSKTVREYSEQQKEKQKQLKDSFATTSEAVLTLQNLSVALLKAKELYQTRSQEVEKCRKDFSNLKDIKNAEIKFKKSTDDYKQLVDKRENARKDFHEKMTEISQKLQSVEEQHLTQMLEILSKYGDSIKVERFLLDQILDEFGRNMVALTVENLLQQFLNLKQTGKDVPVAVDFEEVEMNTMPVDIDAIALAIKEEKKNKKKERRLGRGVGKKKKEKSEANGTVEKVNNDVTNGNQNELQLDEEGYVIRPIDTDSIHSSKSKISSSSDSDSDSDDEGHRIQVTIKPVGESKGSNSDLTGDDELKKLSAALTLMSPASMQGKLSRPNDKKHVTTWGSHGSLNNMSSKSRSNNDLLSIDKNSDTASLRSLPVNSSIASLEKVSSAENNFDASFMSSPVSSPVHENLPDSLGTSPSDSVDRSVESLYTYDDAPPPLPVKNRTMSLDTAGVAEQGITFEANFSESFENSNSSEQEKVSEKVSENIAASLSTEKSASLPLATSFKSSSSLEGIKLPPKADAKLSSVLPPPSSASVRSAPVNASSLPRPKAGQLVPPPSTSSSSRRGIQTSASTGSLPGNNSQSSFSDLMDINFSAVSNTPILAPITREKENTTSHWVNPETPEDTETTLHATSFEGSSSDSVPPLVPRRTTIQAPPQVMSDSCATNVNPAGLMDKAIPIAVAFIETVNGVFKGADEKSCMVKVTGDMTISFPANIISMLMSNHTPPVLSFLVSGTSSLEQIFPNKALVERGGQLPGGEGMTFKFNMVALAAYLRKQAEQGTKASYYNIDILKYQVRNNGMASAPLQLSAYWRCDTEQTDLKIDYKYNSSCMSSPVALNNVSVVVPVDGGVTIMQSRPTAIWSSEHQRCMWKLNAISASVDAGGNALRARFDVTNGPSSPVPIAVQYTGEGSTLSSLNFDLKSPSYKLSLVKKRFASGKYIVEPS